MREKAPASIVEIEDMLEKIDLGLDQVKSMVRSDGYDSSDSNYELKYYIRVTLDAFYLLQNMTGTTGYGDI